MDGLVEMMRDVREGLDEFVEQFVDCIKTRPSQRHFQTYINGQLSDLRRKTVEGIADANDVEPRTLQEFLSVNAWDEEAVRDRLQQIVARDHADPHGVVVIDETGTRKKGTKTPTVARQYLGEIGKTDNGIVHVDLGYATKEFRALLDSEPFVPKEWSEDRERCRKAGIPDEVVHRTKWRIGLEMLDRALGNGIAPRFVAADEAYGTSQQFRDELDRRELLWALEVPCDLKGWVDEPPRMHVPPRRSGRGRPPSKALVAPGEAAPIKIHTLAKADAKERAASKLWQSWQVKETQKGPQVWDVLAIPFYPARRGEPEQQRRWLIIAVHAINEARKYFLSNAPADIDLGELIEVCFARWHIERCFRDAKQHIGLGHYEGRSWHGLKRHLLLSAVSLLFLATQTAGLRKKNRLQVVEH